MESENVVMVDLPPGAPRVWRCRALDRRTGEVLREVEVVARSNNQARKLAKGKLPNYARIVCEEIGPVMME